MVVRKLQLPLNQTQKIRLERALERLQSLSSTANSDTSVIVADSIPVNYEDAFLKGHGTSEINGEVVATLCGVVERVDKLVYVRALRARYKPEVGDIIVGRVIEVAQKRWRLEINFSQDAVLMLSSMNMPDGIQRRRTAVDELNMRNIFEENDVVCAEVRNFQHDGSLQLQARSQKYGKLEKGQILKVDPYLVKRSKHHFHHVEQLGIDLILGCNGFIWVGEHVEVRDPVMADEQKISSSGVKKEQKHTPLETRQSICRIANAIRVLSNLGFSLTLEVITETVNLSTSMNMDVHDMIGPEFHVVAAENEAERRRAKRKR
ncbi:PREDICTED: exosome complex component RRP4 homolog [Tarenaya hassleriana]|uniref:exosome complex component RRP4 homolog n=1 Tax=Tarenaya hassleriana TaxID=28532 RepID=UPI00053C4AE1|nr:PREDICTED: exosome complex component RRP4 homolog [Tarenaya hassleriana]